MSVKERFLNYIRFDTQSDETTHTTPSTAKQKKLGAYLADECRAIGCDEVEMDPCGIVYAKINGDETKPAIGFLAHMDTATEISGADVQPQIIEQYDGRIIHLNETETLQIEGHIGETLITTDGNTLLGGDDKAGIAVIMEAASRLIDEQSPHGPIFLAFTVDEEIGEGTDHFDLKKFPAAYAYTVDGDRIDAVEYENFNAAQAVITIKGKSIHPGDAKGIMVNAGLLVAEFAGKLPADETPATTEGFEGFYHLLKIEGTCEQAQLVYIIRDHDTERFDERKKTMTSIVQQMNEKYDGRLTLEMHDQYHNMVRFMNGDLTSVERAKKAIQAEGLQPVSPPVRGGTDGAMLTEKGLICPNLGTGSYNHHGRYEYASVDEMEKLVRIVLRIMKEV